VSQSPSKETTTPGQGYLDAWQDLATRIRNGNSFSGREPNSVFLNTRGKRFADVSLMSGFGLPDDGRALAITDWDRDGDLDLWVSNRTGPRVRLLRNDYLTKANTLALRLEGDPSKGTPRDAIGAIATITLSDRTKLTRQVTAGDGFLSQSSKWLHFGLGSKATTTKIQVTWPGQTAGETFEAKPSGRWHLRQGTGKATAAKQAAIALKATPLTLPSPPPTMETYLSEPRSAPTLRYRTWSGSTATIDTQPLTLTLLWASWCQPCLKEMELLSTQHKAIQNAGIQVVALNIEEAQAKIEGTEAPSPKALEQRLRKLNWPFASGRASQEMVEALDQAQRNTLYKQEALPLPSSFLWHRGSLVSFTKGAVSADSILAQTQRLQQPVSKHPDHAIPFPGRWSNDHFITHPVAISRVYLEGGYNEHARRYLEEALAKVDKGEAAKRRYQEADIQYMLGETYRLENALPKIALPFYQRATKLNPQHSKATLAHARTLTALRRGKEAATILQTFLKRAPKQHDVLVQLGNTYQSLGQDDQAAAIYESALKVKPDDFQTLNQLCWVLSTSRNPAYRNPRRALSLAQKILQRFSNNPHAIDTAATALASNQQFEKASQLTQRALAVVRKQRNDRLIKELKGRLSLYQQGKPFLR